MATDVLMPKLGLTMKEGTIVNWMKSEGDPVEKGDELVEILTEKITNVVEAPASGVLKVILAGPGDTVDVARPIGIIAAPDEEVVVPETPAPAAPEEVPAAGAEKGVAAREPRPAEGKKVKASPAAKKLAQEKGVDLARVHGTGPGGRVTRDDVAQAAEAGVAPPPTEAEETRPARREPLAGMRKVIAQRMAQSFNNAALVTVDMEVDMTRAIALRQSLNQVAPDRFGGKVSFTDILILVAARVLPDHPSMNAWLEGEELVYHQAVHMGVAVALEEGLIVPVVRNAHSLGLGEISRQVRDLAERARSGQLQPDEYQGSTFTITNLGMFGSDSFTPIVNPPEAGILGVNRIVPKPVVVDDQVVVRPMMTLSLTFDHRIIDGAQAAQFLQQVKSLLEQPETLLL